MREIKIHCGNCTHTFPFCHPSTSHPAQLANLSILCPFCKVELMMPVDEIHFVPRTEVTERALNELRGKMTPNPEAEAAWEKLKAKRQVIAQAYGASLEKQVEIMSAPTPKVMPPHPPEKPAEVIPIDRKRKPRTRRPHLGQQPFQGLKDLLDPND